MQLRVRVLVRRATNWYGTSRGAQLLVSAQQRTTPRRVESTRGRVMIAAFATLARHGGFNPLHAGVEPGRVALAEGRVRGTEGSQRCLEVSEALLIVDRARACATW